MPSTIKSLKEAITSKATPQEAVEKVYQNEGGILNARTSAELPRNVCQAYNIKQHSKSKIIYTETVGLPLKRDTLAEIITSCKATFGTSDAFIRMVAAAPEPMCVLATDQQVCDMARFCTNSNKFCVMTADPTFNLGPFYVTPLSYRHLLENECHQPPVLLGPILIHQTKTFHAFHFLFSSLLGLKPDLIKLCAFGTDGEQELIKAMKLAYPSALHLRCVNHLRSNVKDKLKSLGISAHVQKEFLADIFGIDVGGSRSVALADVESTEQFHSMLSSFEVKWNNLERSCGICEPSFYQWFQKTKAEVFVTSVISEVRSKAKVHGHFTTNQSESINSVIKMQAQWKGDLPKVIENLKAIVDRQYSLLEQAIISKGKLSFNSNYSCFIVDENHWFHTMNEAQCAKHIKSVNTYSFEATEMQPSLEEPMGPHMQASKSIEYNELHRIKTISPGILEGMWEKANKLVELPGYILKPDWCKDTQARLVASLSSTAPHLVLPDKRDHRKLLCDSQCPMFKGFGLCAHTVAAAIDQRRLKELIDVYVESHCSPNLSVLSTEGFSKGVGRKGGLPKRTRVRKMPPSKDPGLGITTSSTSTSACTTGQHNLVSSITTAVSGCTNTCTSSAYPRAQSTSTPISHVPPRHYTSASATQMQPLPSPIATSLFNNSTISASQISPINVLNDSSINIASPLITSSGQQSTTSLGHISPSQSAMGLSSLMASGQLQSILTSPAALSLINQLLARPYVNKNPFTLKILTNKIKVCQSCRGNYCDDNTMNLVVSRLERKELSDLSTGNKILTRESNSHYHCRLSCIQKVLPGFCGKDLVIPLDVRSSLSVEQCAYVALEFQRKM